MKTKLLFNFLLVVGVSAPVVLSLNSCSSFSGNLVFANYSGYMNEDMMDEHRDVKWLTYLVDDDIMNKFAKNYDLAIPTFGTILNLVHDNKLSQVEWDRFELTDADGNLIESGKQAEYFLASKSHGRNNATDAQLIVDSINAWLRTTEGLTWLPASYIDSLDNINNLSILDWCVPYFLSSLSFSYWGENLFDDEVTWENIASAIRDENRFNANQPYQKISLIDDYRTVFDMAKLYTDENDTSSTSFNINQPNDKISQNDYRDIYHNFTNQLYRSGQKSKFYLNGDSIELSNAFLGEGNKHGTGILCYNSDAVYAGIGVGQISSEQELVYQWLGTDRDETVLMSGSTPNNTAMILDGVVFNKELDGNEPRKTKAYEVVADFCIDGINLLDPDGEDQIYDTDEDGNYAYGVMRNFDYVLYTSPWEAIDAYALPSTTADYSSYFADLIWWLFYEETGIGYVDETDESGYLPEAIWNKYFPDTPVEPDYISEAWVDFLSNNYQISYPSGGLNPNGSVNIDLGLYVELPLSALAKSNMHWAYEKTKGAY